MTKIKFILVTIIVLTLCFTIPVSSEPKSGGMGISIDTGIKFK